MNSAKNLKLISGKLANPKSKTFFVNTVLNYLLKGFAMVISLFTMPAYLSYFTSSEVLGVWMTAVSLLNWMVYFDLGIGNGMRNQLVKFLEKNQKNEVKNVISSAYFSVGGIVAALIIVQFVIVPYINWNVVLNISRDVLPQELLSRMVSILIIGALARFFSALVAQIYYAMQKAAIPNLIMVSSNLLTLIWMRISIFSGKFDNVILLAVAYAIAINIPGIVATIFLFCGKLRYAVPSIKNVTSLCVKNVVSLGGKLLYIQVIMSLALGMTDIYISSFVGPKAVVEYQIYYKLIGALTSLFTLSLTPVWSAVTQAKVTKDKKWIISLYKKMILLLLLFSAGQLILIVIMPFAVKIWLGANAIKVSFGAGLIYCIYNVIYMWVFIQYNFACGLGKLKKISFYLSVAAIMTVVLSAIICSFYKSWVSVIIASAIAIIPCAIFTPKDIMNGVEEDA
ncbi:MAG: hypothetical protein RR573_07430 [Oscillospiraceae bacterium]